MFLLDFNLNQSGTLFNEQHCQSAPEEALYRWLVLHQSCPARVQCAVLKTFVTTLLLSRSSNPKRTPRPIAGLDQVKVLHLLNICLAFMFNIDQTHQRFQQEPSRLFRASLKTTMNAFPLNDPWLLIGSPRENHLIFRWFLLLFLGQLKHSHRVRADLRHGIALENWTFT